MRHATNEEASLTKILFRYALDFKSIPYTTAWLEYAEIEPVAKKIGAAPTGRKPDGSPWFTVPIISDPSTGIVLSDGPAIAEYLDKTYPSRPPVYPKGTLGLQLAASQAIYDATLKALFPFCVPPILAVLSPASQEYYRAKIKDIPQGDADWKKVKEGFALIDGWYQKSVGSYIMGNQPTFADFTLIGLLHTLNRTMGEESKEWKDIARWNGKRWGELFAEASKTINSADVSV